MDPALSSRLLRNLAQSPALLVETALRRLQIQLDFARVFASLPAYEDRRDEWLKLVGEAERLVQPADSLESLQKAIRRAEAHLAPIGLEAKSYTIHCVGHGHIDMNWMWSWPETAAVTHDTFASVLSFMDQYPDFTFSQSQASVYELTERYYPSLFERIRQRVAEGRWEVAAAHWVEGDKNLASGESLARHLLYTRAYFKEKFGLEPEDAPVDWEPDTFGHANTIPTILAQGAVKYYYCCRPGGGFEHERIGEPRPKLFWWEGPDGSRVLVNRESTWYNSYVNIDFNIALPMVEFARETGLHEWLNVYGVGNHGGGPTRAEIEYLMEADTWPIYPNVRFSTSKRYFEAVEREVLEAKVELPVLDHELNFEFTGCYTSQSAIKKANRHGENYCVEAEGLQVIAGAVAPQTQVDAPDLRQAWLNVLFNQFHDILPGSGVAATREHALGLFQEAGAITGAIKREAGKALAARLDTASLLPDTPEADEEREFLREGRANAPFVAGAGQGAGLTGLSRASGGGRRFLPYVVYNPCAWERSEVVEVSLYDLDIDPTRIVARDETGTEHPTLLLYHGQHWAHDWGHKRTTLLLLAQSIPAMGYRTFLFCEGNPTPGAAPMVETLNETTFRTPEMEIEFDRFRSGVRSLRLKGSEVSLGGLFEHIGSWQSLVERPRGMTSWVLGEVMKEPRELEAKSYELTGAVRNEGNTSASGGSPVVVLRHELEVEGTKSRVSLVTVFHGLSPRIDVLAQVDWREIGDPEIGIPGLRVRFQPLGGLGPAIYETPFGIVDRGWTDKGEVPSLRFAHVGMEQADDEDVAAAAGFTLLQDAKYGHGFSAEDGLSLRVVRSSYDPDHAPEVAKSSFRYSLLFHTEAPSHADLVRAGMEFNHPLIVFPANLQEGDRPAAEGFVTVRTSGVVLSGLKRAEGGGTLLRLVNHEDGAVGAVVELHTLLAPPEGARVETVDLMERPVPGEASLEDGVLRVRVPGRSFVSVRLST
jgi:alpha-mannosidase